jgi:DMSO/TMAO reductase YedYZ heme-binding membrane subunit
MDVIFPIHAPHQKLFVALGTLSMFALLVVVITTQKAVKRKMSFRAWKNIHFISYGTAMLFIIHGLNMDPHLHDHPIDWHDAEKVLCELCLLVLVVATCIRILYGFRKAKRQVVAR